MRKAVFMSVFCVWWLSPAAGLRAAESPGPYVTVSVDPRVELMSIIFRLAGNPEYSRGRVPSYVQDVDSHFGKFQDHPVVVLARKLRQTRQIGSNAPMSLAVHVTDAVSLAERVPLSPRPAPLDPRWTPENAREFLDLARQFVAEARFQDFFDQHTSLYQVAARALQEVLDQHAHLEWFDQFFGPRKGAEFRVIVSPLASGNHYGAQVTLPDGRDALYSIITVGRTDSQGQPVFSPEVAFLTVHELTHSYTNAMVDRFAPELRGPGEKIFRFVRPEMERQAYGTWHTTMCESLVRACGLRYLLATEGRAALEKQIRFENSWSFYWVGELAEVLGAYDTQPRTFSDLPQFFPRIIAFFDDYAKNAEAKFEAIRAEKEQQLQQWRQKGPKIVAMIPANGAQDVDPNLQTIVVTFDRPMRDGGWATVAVASWDQVPKSTGPQYDQTRKVFTMQVQLQPEKEYVFSLNDERYLGFCSEEGIPLAPVAVRFKTKPADKK